MDKFKKEFLDKIGTDEMLKIESIMNRVENQNKIVEVVYYALLTISESKGKMSPLLALQIAEEDWDI